MKKYVVIMAGLIHMDEDMRPYEAEVGELLELTDTQALSRSGKIKPVGEYVKPAVNESTDVKEQSDKIEAIIEAMKLLDEDDFNADGATPKVHALSRLLGYTVTTQDRDDAMMAIG